MRHGLRKFGNRLAAGIPTPILRMFMKVFLTRPDLADRAGTWSPSIFRGVWHLTDETAGAARDSTGGMHDLASPMTGEAPSLQRAVMASGRLYDGIDDVLRVADDDAFDFGADSFSYSVWVNVSSSVGSFDMPMFKGGSSDGVAGFDFELGTNSWRANIGDGVSNLPQSIIDESEALNRWVHLVAVVDRSRLEQRVYADGAPRTPVTITYGPINSTLELGLGKSDGGSYQFRGQLDEPRVYCRALDPGWIEAEHANLTAPTSFVTLGPEETAR